MTPQSPGCRFVVYGEPVAKGRPRLGARGNVYTPAKTRKAEEALAWEMMAATGPAVATGELEVRLAFHCGTAKRVDIDNLAKLVLDAANDVIWHDDAQVVRLEVTLERRSSEPRTEIYVCLLGVQ